MSFIAEGVAGVVTGLVGTVVTAFTNLKAQKLKNEHELAMVKANTEATIAEVNANIRVTEANLASEMEKMDAQVFQRSIELGNTPVVDNKLVEKLFNNKWTMPFGVLLVLLLGLVEFLRGFMRPGLTGYLVFLTSWITYEATRIIQQKQELLSAAQALDTFNQVTRIVIYLTVSVVTWWFGDRRVGKFLYRLNDGNFREK